MCYYLYISTDSSENLSIYNTEFVKFEKLSDTNNNLCTALLDHTNKWYVDSEAKRCGCSFRHLYIGAIELGFSKPVDWYKEDAEHIQATNELYSVLLNLLTSGFQVDLIDIWQGAQPEDIVTIEVSFDKISEKAFRLFENHKFILKKV
jgi:hypothetical protein